MSDDIFEKPDAEPTEPMEPIAPMEPTEFTEPTEPLEPAEHSEEEGKRKKPKLKSLLLIICSAVLVAAITLSSIGIAQGWFLPEPVPTTYPYIFVHGLNGWGDDTDALLPVSYWGATSCRLMDELTAAGYTCHAPSGGPASSAWDRACELYAQLTGTQVDYGAAHSEQYGHDRYGETCATALVPGWGKRDENRNMRKINLIGHSFGGATIRLLAQMLEYGSEEEQSASPEDCSSLFAGGKGDWIYSITALTAPHNGTTLLYAIGDGTGIVSTLLNAASSAQQFLKSVGFDISFNMASHELSDIARLSATRDNAYYDLTLQGADELNAAIGVNPNIYYFSYPFDGTTEFLGWRVGSSDMMLILQPIAAIIGNYKTNTQSAHTIDNTWLPNDGLVNTISEYAPGNAVSKDFQSDAIEKGIWQVMPTTRGDHGTPIGLMQTKDWTLQFYKTQLERIDGLSLAETSIKQKGWTAFWDYLTYKEEE